MNTAQGTDNAASGHQPLISVVIPVFNLADYLPECLDSITRQDFRDIEIIAVDGASQDTSHAILDRRSAEDPRLTVLHTDEIIGPGRARNLGARHARGEYLWFVDGDDVVVPGSLSRIAKRVEAVRPDVLFLTHEEFYPDRGSTPGRRVLGHGHDLMGADTPACFSLTEQPWIIDLSMASWNKVVRTQFFIGTAANFWQDSPHEDVFVSCLLMLEAHKLSVLETTCYAYRKDRVGSAMLSGRRRRHFNIFRSYEAVLDQVAKRAGNGDQRITDEVRYAFFQRAMRHYTAIFDSTGPGIGPIGKGGLIARRDRRDFFELMHWHYVRFRPGGCQRASGLHGIKSFLIEKDHYWAYSLLEPMNWLRVRMARRVGELRDRLNFVSRPVRQTGRPEAATDAIPASEDRMPTRSI